jgi:hypothetical protein
MVLGAAKRLDRHRQGNRLGIFLVVLGMVSILPQLRKRLEVASWYVAIRSPVSGFDFERRRERDALWRL